MRITRAPVAELDSMAARGYPAFPARTPNFCSGCPHSASTALAEGQVAFGAPSCACFNSVTEQPERHIDTMTQYGGEGLPWIGLAPYTDRSHLVQHVGDGSMYDSSYLSVRWAVATNTRITFKLLWNGVMAAVDRSEFLRAADQLIGAVTMLIYDESCANERRRRIKRGLLPTPTQYVLHWWCPEPAPVGPPALF